MNRELNQRIISLFERIRQYPSAYLSLGHDSAVNWFHGFYTALEILGVNYEQDASLYQDVLSERGWEWSSAAPMAEMRRRKFSEEEMVDELFAIHIEVWKRRMEQQEETDQGNSDQSD